MRREIKAILLRLLFTFWSRLEYWVVQAARKKLLCRTLRDFRPKLERPVLDVNRDSHVMHTELVIALCIRVSKESCCQGLVWVSLDGFTYRRAHFDFQQTDSVQEIDRGLLPSDGRSACVGLVFSLLPTSCMNRQFSSQTVQRVLWAKVEIESKLSQGAIQHETNHSGKK